MSNTEPTATKISSKIPFSILTLSAVLHYVLSLIVGFAAIFLPVLFPFAIVIAVGGVTLSVLSLREI